MTTQFDYDANGNERRVLEGVEGSEQITTSTYDCADRLALVEDAMGNQTSFKYDAAGNQIEQSFHGELVDLPGPGANVLLSRTRVSYDAMNRPVVTSRDHFDPASQTPIGDGASVTTRVYDRESRVILEIDDNGEQAAREYDAAGRPLRTIDAEGNIVELTYDANGNVIERALTDVSSSSTDAVVGVWRYVYDEGNNLVQTTDPLGNASHNCYDSLGRLTAEVDPRGNRTLHKHDGLGRLIESAHVMTDDGTGAGDETDIIVTRQTWDDSDRLASREDPGGNVTLYEYDSLNRLTREQFADGGANTFSYDAHDNLVSQQDPSGTQLVFGLDQLGRRVGVTVIPGPGVNADTSFERFAFDGRSLLVGASDDDSQISWRHDSLGAALLETQTATGGPARAITYARDGLGNATATTYPGGRVVERSFDGLRRTRTLTEGGAPLVQFDYLGPSVARRTYFQPNTTSEYTYDVARRMVASEHVELGGEVIDSRTY
ncbi:RHS repeat protein, partial [Enhygromyxa salina]|uniref:RHS repeat protein n=1 Tax=Enhygromyxa salina TaxID=215803 RepID=UPI0013FCF9FB